MKWERPFLIIDRNLAGKSLKQLLGAIIPFAIVFVGVFLCYLFIRNGSVYEKLGQAFVDTTVPSTIYNEVYDTIQPFNNDVGQCNAKPSLGDIIWFTIIYIFGTIAFTGLLISAITNIWRTRAEKFRRGTVSYNFKGHIVFIGYNNLVPGMIQKICEENEDTRVVVGVEDKASTISDKIKNRLWEKYRNNVVTLKADSCNREDLKRLRVPYAEEVYIIGEHDDAYNLKCYRTIYELSLCDYSRESKMPKCYVNLHSQATLTLFRTYASADELGIDFTNFHSFSFYDEWAKYMIKKHWESSEDIQDHFIIAGMTEMGIALARKIVLLCHKPSKEKHTIINFIDDDMVSKSKLFIIQNQDFFDRCHYKIKTRQVYLTHEPEADKDLLDVAFEFIEGNLSEEEIRQKLNDTALDEKKTTTIAICHDDPQQNITMGLSLPKNFNGDNCDARVWIYQPTLGDLGKYLESERYTYFETFGMSGEELDVRNEICTKRALLINHFFLHKKEPTLDFSKKFLIETEWEGTDIAKRWICIRHAEYIPFLTKYKDSDSKMTTVERNRSVADIFLFGEESLYSLENDFYSKYIDALKSIVKEK